MSELAQVTVALQLAGDPVPVGAQVYLTLDRPDFDGDTAVPRRVMSAADGQGRVQLSLWPNERGRRGSGYDLQVIYDGRTILSERVVLPDLDGVLSLANYFVAPSYPPRPDIEQLTIEAAQAADAVLAAYGDAQALAEAVDSASDSAEATSADRKAVAAAASTVSQQADGVATAAQQVAADRQQVASDRQAVSIATTAAQQAATQAGQAAGSAHTDAQQAMAAKRAAGESAASAADNAEQTAADRVVVQDTADSLVADRELLDRLNSQFRAQVGFALVLDGELY